MRLTGFYIDGFGLFHNLKIEDLSPQLTLFLGENESGKSTLLGFLRAILFGFPDRRSNENPYPPLSGGRHGGNIAVATDNRQAYVVERYPGPRGGKVEVLKPDHSEDVTSTLDRLLGTANRTLFKNIYGFSLSELQNFESLNTESVKEALFSAGAGIDPSRLTRLKSDLEKFENDLFKPGGTKPAINVTVSRLQAILKEKRALSGAVDQYDQLSFQISQLKEEIGDLERKRVTLSVQLRKQEEWLQIWPDWINLSLAKQKLESLEVIEAFPAEGLSRYENLKNRLEDAKKDHQEKEENLRRQESEFSAQKTDPDLLEQAASIKQLQRNQGHFDAVVEESFSLREELTNAEDRLKQSLGRLGVNWNEDAVLGFDLSVATREEVRRFRDDLRQAELAVQKKRSGLDKAASVKREAEKILRSLREPSVKDPEQLVQMRKSCQELKVQASRIHDLENELDYTHERVDGLRQDRTMLEDDLKRRPYAFPFWPVPSIMAAGLLYLIWAGSNQAWDQGAMVAILALVVGFSLWFARSGMRRGEKERSRMEEGRLHLLVAKIEALESKSSEIRSELEHNQKQTDAAKSVLSLSEIPGRETLEGIEEQLLGQIDTLDRWRKASEDLEEAKRGYDEASEALAQSEGVADETLARWEAWLKSRGLDKALTPEGALETLSLIESCKEQVGRINQLRSKSESFEETKKAYIHLANEVLTASRRKEVAEDNIRGAVQNLIQEFSEAEQAAQNRDLLLREMAVSRESIQRIQKQASKLEEELQALMHSGGAEEEEEFRKRGLVYEEREGLKRETEKYQDNIRRLAGTLDALDVVLESLSELKHETLEEERGRLEQELKEIDATLDRLKREQATLEEQARQLTKDETISALRAEEEGLKEQLAGSAREWSVVRLAQGLIRMGSVRYEKEMQPEVVGEAARFFERLTLGRYPSLVAPIGENRIGVVSEDHGRKQIEELSRGTAEQLYLSLRFGFIQEYSKRSESLPIIMDEILVNFDPPRAKATVGTILELSEEHQVLFFTCHPETVHLFREADPRVPVLEFSGGGVKTRKGNKGDNR